ncbi:MAG TPA: Ig-like domain-containing protein, partial [Vicinamibacterales bacterium]|nr:Ig-like domain-containing protein [Vicinamibacterales bacterium]
MVSWTTSEPATSLVEYSTDFTFPTTQTQTVTSGAFVTSRSLLIAGLQPNTTYYYRATSIDAAGNRTTSEAPSFTVPGPTLRDTAQSDFLAGSGTGTYASETDDGELILAPLVGTEFSGSTLPRGWIEFVWGSTSGYTAMGGGEMIVDGVRVAMCATDTAGNCLPGEAFASTPSAIFTSPHSMEFVATFTGDAFQHAGLGQTLGSGSEPWAIFSTMSGGALNARTNTGAGSIDTFLGSGLVGAPHLFRIDWKTNSVDYFVDGNLVVSHPLTVAGPMRPIAASDFNEFGGNVTVNWVRLTPYTSNGTFLSRVFDANSRVDWHSIQWNAATPAGASVAISVRTGDTPTPDGTWTAFTPIASGGPLTMNSQFIQYQAVLSSASSQITPRLDDIIISTGHAPVANPDSVIVPENGTHLFQPSGSGSLTANDTDADPGDVLLVVGVTAPAHGTAVLNADGSVAYTPAANYSGSDAFTYTVSDGLLTASAVVSIDVRFGNVPPVAVNDFYSINEDSTLTVPAAIGVLANDTDTEHDALSAMLTALPLHGTLSFGANGGFSYVPVANYAGPDAFRYKANDGADESNEAVVTITVNQVNDPPITAPDNYVAVLNQPLDVPAAFNVALGRYVSGVLANDRDVEVEDTAPMHAQLVAGPAHGHLVFGTDGGFSYTPDADFLGADSFTYQAVDHLNAAGNVSTVTITVALKAVAASVSAGATVTTGNGGVDPNDPLHSSVTSPTSATVTIAQGVIAASQAPTGYTFLNQQVNISVLGPDGNDISADSSAPIKLVFFIDRSLVPAGVDENGFQMFRNGVLIPNCLGATTIPAANLDPCVTDRADGPSLNNNIRLTILTSHASKWNMGLSSDAIGDAPVAMNDGPYLVDYQTPLIVSAPGVLGNDIGRSSISALLVGTPVNGTVNLTPSGAFTFNPDPAACGAASFSYRATDGALQSADAIVSITIDCKPHAGDDAVTVLEDSGVTTITVLANDSDPDPGQTLSVGSVTQPANGVAAVAMSGSVVTYRPNLNFFGADSFTYTVSDNRGGSATGTVSVTVKPVNDAPKFTAGGNVTVLEDAAAQTTANWATGISAGPANESGQALNFIVSNTNNALFSAQPAVAANGTLTFTPAANANGSATVSVQAHDDGGTLDGGVDTSAAQSFTITVTAVNDAPSFVKGADQARFGIVGVQTVANWATAISAGPADEAGQALNFIVSNDNNAMFAVQPAVAADGTLSYTPAANVIGSAIVTVALHDNGGTANGGVDTSAPQTFAISVSKAATTTTLTSSVNPSVYGQAVTFTATVGVVAPGTGQPSGTVTFMDGATTLGSATLDATGRGSFSVSSLSAVAHTVTAVYGGAAAFSASTSSALTQTVAKALVTVTADSKSKVYGTANPALTVTYSGFVNGDTVAVVTTPATVSTTATAASAVGSYPITAS